MLGLRYASAYGGGNNDNASDAQREIHKTFDYIMNALREDVELSREQLHGFIYENGVLRLAIAFGDPYHIANLCVTWASIFAFGETEKADHPRPITVSFSKVFTHFIPQIVHSPKPSWTKLWKDQDLQFELLQKREDATVAGQPA